DIRQMVRNGFVAYELCRPVDLYSLWFARAIAHRTAPTLLRVVPMTIIAAIVLPLVGLDEWALRPPTLGAGLAFAVTLVAAIARACALGTVVNFPLLGAVGGGGVVMIAGTVVAVGSGMLVPLPLFPDGLQAVLTWLPF